MKLTTLIAGLAILTNIIRADDELAAAFTQPPDSTKPRCYWYWMDGNFTKERITKDLEAMKRVGIGEGYIGMISGQAGKPTRPGTPALTEPFSHQAMREFGGIDPVKSSIRNPTPTPRTPPTLMASTASA